MKTKAFSHPVKLRINMLTFC